MPESLELRSWCTAYNETVQDGVLGLPAIKNTIQKFIVGKIWYDIIKKKSYWQTNININTLRTI